MNATNTSKNLLTIHLTQTQLDAILACVEVAAGDADEANLSAQIGWDWVLDMREKYAVSPQGATPVGKLADYTERTWFLGTDVLVEDCGDLTLMESGRGASFSREEGAIYHVGCQDNDDFQSDLDDREVWGAYSNRFKDVLMEARNRGYTWVFFDCDITSTVQGTDVLVETSRLPMTEDEYAEAFGLRCPICTSDGVDGGPVVDNSNGFIIANNHCGECGASWRDQFKLVGYAGLELEDGTEVEVPEGPGQEPPQPVDVALSLNGDGSFTVLLKPPGVRLTVLNYDIDPLTLEEADPNDSWFFTDDDDAQFTVELWDPTETVA